jgi:protein-S-isoprenylcysteine O-methyltransferase Ste14
MKEYTATILLGIALGLFLAFWFYDVSRRVTEFNAYTISAGTAALIASIALFAWSWQTRR